MLSRLKRKSDADAAPQVPSWHPNFRNYQKLPDIKVVRTAFFINGAVITAALALAIFVGMREWQLTVLKGQTAEAEQRIAQAKPKSDQAVALFKKFQAEEAKINEVDAFLNAKPKVSTILLRLGETRPPDIAFDAFDLRETGLTLRFSVRGEPAVASGHATAYIEQLRADKELAIFDDVQFTAPPTRNPSTNLMTVEFFLRLKGENK